MRCVLLISFAHLACSTGDGQSRRLPDRSGSANAIELVLSETGIGPIGAGTRATVGDIKTLLPGHQVAAVEGDLVTVFSVSRGGERLFDVVPSSVDGSVYSIDVYSPLIRSDRGWAVGGELGDATQLAGCECRANLTCFMKGSRIGVTFFIDCNSTLSAGAPAEREKLRKFTSGDRAAIATLSGQRIRVLVWQPTPLDQADSR